MTWIIDGKKCRIELKLDPKKTPKTMDMIIAEGVRSLYVYEIKDDVLRICFVSEKSDSVRPAVLSSTGQQMIMTFVRKKRN
jgi:uncharacterized protein (TIGR03067 family)